jgi:hypothetical protein
MPAYTWATGETITATKLNTLETEAWRVANQIASGTSTSESSTASTTFVNLAASVTFTTKSTSVYIEICGGGFYITSASYTAFLGININSTDYTVSHSRDPEQAPFCGGILVTGLTANTSYTARIRGRVDNAAGTLYVNQAGSSRQTITVWDISK